MTKKQIESIEKQLEWATNELVRSEKQLKKYDELLEQSLWVVDKLRELEQTKHERDELERFVELLKNNLYAHTNDEEIFTKYKVKTNV